MRLRNLYLPEIVFVTWLLCSVGQVSQVTEQECREAISVGEIVSRIDGLRQFSNSEPSILAETKRIMDGLADSGFLHRSEIWGISATPTYPGLPLFYILTFAETNRIIRDLKFRLSLAEQLIQKSGVDRDFDHLGFSLYGPHLIKLNMTNLASDLLRSARLIRATRYIENFGLGTQLTSRNFLRLARIEEWNVIKIAGAYRYDSRPPAMIKQIGFRPNPSKPRGSLMAHVYPLSVGAFFVSLSYMAGNEVSLQSIRPGLFAEVIAPELVDGEQLKRLEIAAENKNWLPPGEHPRLHVLYEYKVLSGFGAESTAQAGIAGESEIVAPFITPDAIQEVREVVILVGRKKVTPLFGETYVSTNSIVLASEFGEWQML